MKAVESEGASVEEAVERALLLLGVGADEVDVVVLREADANGGSATARVRVEPRSSQDAVSKAPETPSVPEPVTPEPEPAAAAERKPARAKDRRGRKPASGDTSVSGETLVATREEASREDDGSEHEVPLSEEEGERADRAGDFLEDLFEKMDLDCYVEVAADIVDGKILIDIGGPDTGVIIGRKGAVLDAVEFMANRAIDNVDGGGTRISLDAASYRERRAEKLRELAAEQASRVAQTARPVSLEPMTPRERRIVHIALRANPDVQTRSEGEGPDRFVIIEPSRGSRDG